MPTRDSEERLLTTLASAMGVALDNARLVEETRRRAAELTTVNEVGQAVAAQLDLNPLIELVGEKIGTTFSRADVVGVALHDPSAGESSSRSTRRTASVVPRPA